MKLELQEVQLFVVPVHAKQFPVHFWQIDAKLICPVGQFNTQVELNNE